MDKKTRGNLIIDHGFLDELISKSLRSSTNSRFLNSLQLKQNKKKEK
jgi:hypothetical protein